MEEHFHFEKPVDLERLTASSSSAWERGWSFPSGPPTSQLKGYAVSVPSTSQENRKFKKGGKRRK